MGGESVHNAVTFAVSATAFIIHLCILRKMIKFNKSILFLPGSSVSEAILIAMVGLTSAQLIDLVSVFYFFFSNKNLLMIENIQFASSDLISAVSMAVAYAKVRRIS